MNIGFIHSIIRQDEKLLLKAFEKASINIERIDTRKLRLIPNIEFEEIDGAINRTLSTSQGLYTVTWLEHSGIQCFNSSTVSTICADKILTSLHLQGDVDQPHFELTFSQDSALDAIEEMGYPIVIKPPVGSWGRLIAKINDRDAAEAIIEHKSTLGSYQHNLFYLQEYLPKPNRDIRSFVIGDQVVAAIYRNSEHWISNTARGGKATNCPINDELEEISINAAQAIGGGILAIDIVETTSGLQILEVNHTMEFKNSISTTGVDIPGKMVEYIVDTIKC